MPNKLLATIFRTYRNGLTFVVVKGGKMWRSAWAKAPREQLGEYETWLPLDTHLKDTGYLIRHLWDHWLGEGPKQVIVHDFGGDAFVAKQVATFAAVLHDIGKLTPAFAGMVLPKRNHMESAGFRWPAG